MTEYFNVGIVGYCAPTKFDREEAWTLVEFALDRAVSKKQPGQKIRVIGGLTDINSIHQLAYYIARQRGWNVGGIACEKAKGYKWFPMSNDGDVLNITGENWGDESEDFVSRCDVLIRVGGGKQSHKEVEMARARGIHVDEAELK